VGSATPKRIKLVVHRLVKVAAAVPWLRFPLNALYLRLKLPQYHKFYSLYAKAFRESALHPRGGVWTVSFAGRRIRMLLTTDRFWLDWDNALAITGHDITIKQTYSALIRSSACPQLLVDIGANYGTHSLLFLAHGIPTLTFEPNSSCHDYFLRCCRLNGYAPFLEHVALGEIHGSALLSYPKRETWLGSTNAEVTKELSTTRDLITETVEQRPLDDYLLLMAQRRTLIKIDVEGNEIAVLRGAERTLKVCRPFVIFECRERNEWRQILKFFQSKDYEVHALPWSPDAATEPMAMNCPHPAVATNFIAIPKQ
jgi:FkbM family methyltransferase